MDRSATFRALEFGLHNTAKAAQLQHLALTKKFIDSATGDPDTFAPGTFLELVFALKIGLKRRAFKVFKPGGKKCPRSKFFVGSGERKDGIF